MVVWSIPNDNKLAVYMSNNKNKKDEFTNYITNLQNELSVNTLDDVVIIKRKEGNLAFAEFVPRVVNGRVFGDIEVTDTFFGLWLFDKRREAELILRHEMWHCKDLDNISRIVDCSDLLCRNQHTQYWKTMLFDTGLRIWGEYMAFRKSCINDPYDDNKIESLAQKAVETIINYKNQINLNKDDVEDFQEAYNAVMKYCYELVRVLGFLHDKQDDGDAFLKNTLKNDNHQIIRLISESINYGIRNTYSAYPDHINRGTFTRQGERFFKFFSSYGIMCTEQSDGSFDIAI